MDQGDAATKQASAPQLSGISRIEAIEAERLRHSRLLSAFVAMLVAGAALTLIYLARPVLIVVAISILLAFMLAPIVSLLEHIHIPKSVSSAFAVLLLLAALYGAFLVSYSQASDFVDQLPRYSGSIRHALTHFRQRAEKIRKTTENVLPAAPEDKNTVHIKQTDNLAEALTRGAASLTETLALASFIPFLVYFMLSWQDHVRTATVMIFKRENRNTAYVTLGLIAKMMRSFIVGNLLVGIFLSAISMLIFGVIGVPYFYFIAIISGFFSLIPYLGAVLAAVPPLVAGLDQMDSQRFLIIMASVVGTHLFALNVLYPKLIGKRMQLNPLAVTLSLLFWGWLWGAVGLLLAVPITATVKIIFDHVERLRPYGTWLGDSPGEE